MIIIVRLPQPVRLYPEYLYADTFWTNINLGGVMLSAQLVAAKRELTILQMVTWSMLLAIFWLMLFCTPVAASAPKEAAAGKVDMAAGKQLFTTHCGVCHSIGPGAIDIKPLTAHLTRLGMEAYIEGQGRVFDHMPLFTGTREERDTIAAYIVEGVHGKVEKPHMAEALPQLPLTVPAFDVKKDPYVLLAWCTLGMKCITDCDAAYSYLPPGSALGAVLIRRGDKPEVVHEGIDIQFEVEKGFEHPSRHTQYWKYAESISGKKLPADISAAGVGMKGSMKWMDKAGQFEIGGIPLVPYSDDGTVNPYPMFTVRAVEAASGKVVASTSVVAPVGTEMSCWRCHGGGWAREEGTGVSLQTARSILAVHDKRSGTDLSKRALAGQPVLCQSCHPDPLLKAKGDPERLNLPAAIHGFHANYLKGRGDEACSNCHPDSNAGLVRCLRDSHGQAGMTCIPCHGYLEDHAVSLLKREQGAGKPRAEKLMTALSGRLVPDNAAINARTPWAQEPDCSTCHTDKYIRPKADALAFNVWTKDGSGLYRVQKDMTGKVPCIACHSSPHATHPSSNPMGKDRDAVQAMQYQNLNAPIGAQGNCRVCHGAGTMLTPAMAVHHPMK